MAVTFTRRVHAPERPITPPAMVSVVSPAAGVNVGVALPAPVHDALVPGVDATSIPAGSASVTVVSGIAAPEFGLDNVSVSWDTPEFCTTVVGEKLLPKVGGDSVSTLNDCAAGVPLLTAAPSFPVTAPLARL